MVEVVCLGSQAPPISHLMVSASPAASAAPWGLVGGGQTLSGGKNTLRSSHTLCAWMVGTALLVIWQQGIDPRKRCVLLAQCLSYEGRSLQC